MNNLNTNKKMENKIINKIIKMGFNAADAEVMVAKYYDMATRRGAETVKEYANEITCLYCF